MEAIAHICDSMIFKFDGKFITDSIYDDIKDIARPFDETLIECTSPYESGDCSELFVPIYTEEGLCFSFNALNSHQVFTDE